MSLYSSIKYFSSSFCNEASRVTSAISKSQLFVHTNKMISDSNNRLLCSFNNYINKRLLILDRNKHMF